MIIRIITSCLIIIAGFSLNGQADWDKVEIKTHQIKDQIYMLEGRGGNIAVFTGDDGTLMIDDQFAPLSEKIKTAIAEISDHPIKFLINTHWHGDHTGGNENFANDGAMIIAHDNVYARLSSDQIRPFGRTTPASPEAAWPQLTFNEEMKIHFNGMSVQLIHVHNAHTDGDAFIYFSEANVLHMGDCFFKDRFPYVDTEMGGSPAGAIEAVELALMLIDEETVIIPGHGSLASKEDLSNYYKMWTTMSERVKQLIADEVSLEDVDFEKTTEGYESWGTGFINPEKMVKTLYNAYREN